MPRGVQEPGCDPGLYPAPLISALCRGWGRNSFLGEARGGFLEKVTCMLGYNRREELAEAFGRRKGGRGGEGKTKRVPGMCGSLKQGCGHTKARICNTVK